MPCFLCDLAPGDGPPISLEPPNPQKKRRQLEFRVSLFGICCAVLKSYLPQQETSDPLTDLSPSEVAKMVKVIKRRLRKSSQTRDAVVNLLTQLGLVKIQHEDEENNDGGGDEDLFSNAGQGVYDRESLFESDDPDEPVPAEDDDDDGPPPERLPLIDLNNKLHVDLVTQKPPCKAVLAKGGVYPCPHDNSGCDKAFRSKVELYKHYLRAHCAEDVVKDGCAIAEEPVECLNCKEEFPSRAQLKVHMDGLSCFGRNKKKKTANRRRNVTKKKNDMELMREYGVTGECSVRLRKEDQEWAADAGKASPKSSPMTKASPKVSSTSKTPPRENSRKRKRRSSTEPPKKKKKAKTKEAEDPESELSNSNEAEDLENEPSNSNQAQDLENEPSNCNEAEDLENEPSNSNEADEKEDDNFRCSECPESFPSKRLLTNHAFYAHTCPRKDKKKTAKSHTCPTCNTAFTRPFALRRHARRCKGAEEEKRKEGLVSLQETCPKCERVYPSRVLSYHVKRCTGE